MKSFTQNKPEKINRFAFSEILKNEIDTIVEKNITIESDGEIVNDPMITIDGIKELVESIETIVKKEQNKIKLEILKEAKDNPLMIKKIKNV